MSTYLGIDNVQNDRLVLVCLEFRGSGQIAPLWRQKLRGERVISQFFDELARGHGPIAFVTTWVGNDPAGVLSRQTRRGGHLLRYHAWELDPHKTIHSNAFKRAESLALQAIHDEEIPLIIQHLRRQLAGLNNEMLDLCREAKSIDQRLRHLESRQVDEIPF